MCKQSETTDCRLLIDPPGSGEWNMAVDEVLLEQVAAGGDCCWRFYRWAEPTLSLGYFQPIEDRDRHAASRDCPVVRRASGGGAIVHDAELTYSFVVPATHPLAARRSLMYRAVHDTLLEVLPVLGLQGSLHGNSDGRQSDRQAFLCFERRSPGDVIVGESKIAGSAQRRMHSAVLQHGSLLLARSAAAPELDGVEDLSGTSLSFQPLIDLWLERLSRRLRLDWHVDPLSEREKLRAAELVQTKYGNRRWTENRGRQAAGKQCRAAVWLPVHFA